LLGGAGNDDLRGEAGNDRLGGTAIIDAPGDLRPTACERVRRVRR